MPTARDEILNLFARHRHADAAEAAHAYLQGNPHDVQILKILADSAIGAGHLDAAEPTAEYLLTLGRTPERLATMATVLSARGDLADAIALLREALSLDPTSFQCWGLIAGIHRFTKSDPLIAKAKRMLARNDLHPITRRAILYALSKAMNDLGKWNKAWDYAAKGAALSSPDYNIDEFDNWASDAAEAFDIEFLKARAGRGSQSTAPIFVVGMPRSGTTLMEIILASTGQVAPMGELTTIPDVTAKAAQDDAGRGHTPSSHAWVRRWRDSAFTEFAEHYLMNVARRSGGEVPRHFVDKLPGNVLYLGQIALFFPNARIIRMHRDPLDTCVSCYMGQFDSGHEYTYRIDWLARAAQGFRQIGDMLTPMLPNPVIDVHYEDLVTNPEPEIRRILELLDVEWNPACLTPSPSGYASTTRSVEQVRNPINAKSVGRWRRYADRIGPLAQALGLDIADAA